MKVMKPCELAAKLFPDTPPRSATQRLRRWIAGDAELQKRLARRGYAKGQRLLTPCQVRIITNWIG